MSSGHGIFCLEGDWYNDFNRNSSVKPGLKLLAQAQNRPVPFVHRDVETREEFEHYCRRWRQKSAARYPMLYLAFHGKPGCLMVGNGRQKKRSKVCLDDLADILGTRLKERVLHLGSCNTLNAAEADIQRFLQKTGINAISGFEKEVEWVLSSVFDVLLFSALRQRKLTLPAVRRVEKFMRHEYGFMCRKLHFRMVVRKP